MRLVMFYVFFGASTYFTASVSTNGGKQLVILLDQLPVRCATPPSRQTYTAMFDTPSV
eukprot:m.16700 g.16700  ORF g.16700 m.16700 type:complete len:58 (-) comp11162_c0_seq2:24-197(-)